MWWFTMQHLICKSWSSRAYASVVTIIAHVVLYIYMCVCVCVCVRMNVCIWMYVCLWISWGCLLFFILFLIFFFLIEYFYMEGTMKPGRSFPGVLHTHTHTGLAYGRLFRLFWHRRFTIMIRMDICLFIYVFMCLFS